VRWDASSRKVPEKTNLLCSPARALALANAGNAQCKTADVEAVRGTLVSSWTCEEMLCGMLVLV
jgi:hypothetical protein